MGSKIQNDSIWVSDHFTNKDDDVKDKRILNSKLEENNPRARILRK